MYACARQYEKEIFDFVFEHWEGISLGWAQEGLSQNRPATTRLRMDTIESLSAWIIFMRGIFGFYIVRAQRCLWCFKFNARHNWRQDIVTHIVTTYASRYKQRLRNDTIVWIKQLYEFERNNLCINSYTLHVTTTGFSTHEIEIFDFVIECGEKLSPR